MTVASERDDAPLYYDYGMLAGRYSLSRSSVGRLTERAGVEVVYFGSKAMIPAVEVERLDRELAEGKYAKSHPRRGRGS